MKPEIDINVDDIEVRPTTEDESANEQEKQKDVQSETDNNSSIVIDENDITVEDKAPIVMLFGPRSSGKTMTLVRLSRYLRECGYTIKADTSFKSDKKYKEKCENFLRNLGTKEALPGNAYNDFLLIQVIKQGNTICQILEAPGEHYFDLLNVSAKNFPPYMTEIIRKTKNRKIWVFITEAEWDVNKGVKKSYVTRIANCKAQLVRKTDRFVVLYNKVDNKEELFDDGHLYVSSAEQKMRQEYDGLAQLFINKNFITRLWRKYNYKFVPFCTGYYKEEKGKLTYTESEDRYPRLFWKALMKCIRG